MTIEGVIVYYLLAVIAIVIPIYLFIHRDATVWIKRLKPRYTKAYGAFGVFRILMLIILILAGFLFFGDWFSEQLN